MAKPTSPTRWADTASTNRTAIDTGLRDVGFPAGAIIPAGENNQRDFEVGEWLTYIKRGGEVIPIPAASAQIDDGTSGTVTPFVSGSAGVRIAAGGAGVVYVLLPTIWCAGNADKVSVYVDNITGTFNIRWRIYDSSITTTSTAPVGDTGNRSYSNADDATTVEQSFSGTPALAGPAYIIGIITFATGTDTIDLDLIKAFIA